VRIRVLGAVFLSCPSLVIAFRFRGGNRRRNGGGRGLGGKVLLIMIGERDIWNERRKVMDKADRRIG